MKNQFFTIERRTILIIIIILLICGLASAQEPAPYKVVNNEIVSTTAVKVKQAPELTKYTYKGKEVYRGSKGGLFVYMTSKKSGKVYKKYLKI